MARRSTRSRLRIYIDKFQQTRTVHLIPFTMDSTRHYSHLQEATISLSDLTSEEKDLFCGAIYRSSELWSPSTRNLPSLLENFKRGEQERIKALPSYMLRKPVREHRFLPNRPHPKGFCRAHQEIHPYIIGSLLHKVKHEVTGPHFNLLVPLSNPDAQALAESLRAINAYWTSPEDYAKIFVASSTTSAMFQENGCDVCVLAAISGSTEALEALRTAGFARQKAGGSLVLWIDSWLSLSGTGAQYQVQQRSEKRARAIRRLKWGYGSTTGGKQKEKKDKKDKAQSKGREREAAVYWSRRDESEEREKEEQEGEESSLNSWTSDIVDDYIRDWDGGKSLRD